MLKNKLCHISKLRTAPNHLWHVWRIFGSYCIFMILLACVGETHSICKHKIHWTCHGDFGSYSLERRRHAIRTISHDPFLSGEMGTYGYARARTRLPRPAALLYYAGNNSPQTASVRPITIRSIQLVRTTTRPKHNSPKRQLLHLQLA